MSLRAVGLQGPESPGLSPGLLQGWCWLSCCTMAASPAFSRGNCCTVRGTSTEPPKGSWPQDLKTPRYPQRGAGARSLGGGGRGSSRRVPREPHVSEGQVSGWALGPPWARGGGTQPHFLPRKHSSINQPQTCLSPWPGRASAGGWWGWSGTPIFLQGLSASSL